MTEQVTSLELGVEWDPVDPEAVLLANDEGRAVLALDAHFDDPDQRTVVLSWSGARYSAIGGPNDEARKGHRLYNKGLGSVLWIGEVAHSELIAALEKQDSVHARHDPIRFAHLLHHVVLTKESTIEVIADSLVVSRVAGSTIEAAVKAVETQT
jgi:hypothetical protein